jgi:quinol monooxygenase YgiN
MSKVAVIAKITAKPGQGEAVVSRLSQLFDPVAGEAGTEVYSLHTDLSNSDVIWFYELYADNDALAAHGGSDHLAAAFKDLADLTAGRPELNLLNPVQAKGLSF